MRLSSLELLLNGMSPYAICAEHVVKYTRLWCWSVSFNQIVIEMKTVEKGWESCFINGLKP